jgi:predicted nucleotidyltransferase component of viral defense system
MTLADNPILTDDQKALLARFSASNLHDAFYLTGGTALSAVYLQHRLSEDLDFFSEADVAIEEILAFVKSLTGVRDMQYERKYDRKIFLLHYANANTMKVEFTRYPFARVEAGPIIDGVSIDSLQDILVNKLMAMTDRLDAKDYVDLYCAFKSRPDLELEKLLDQTAVKFGVKGVRYILSGRFLQPLPPWGVLSMRRQLDKEDMARFYSQHAKAWIAHSKEGL